LAEQLEAYVSTRHAPHIHLSREEPEPLETGGGIAKAIAMLGTAPFVALNSDAIFVGQSQHPVRQMADAWDDTAMDFCMALVHRDNAHGWQGNGDFVRDAATEKIRKPRAGEQADYIFTGAELIHPRVFKHCPQGAFSLNVLWNASRDADGFYGRVHAVVIDGAWLNVGDIAGHAEAERFIAARR
jgi:N-acetyl-alpha-D-muramate 1-phosphate uridylyltransferase